MTRRKARVFGIWVNAESRTFVDVPSYLSVLSTRPFDDFTDEATQRRLQIGLSHTLLTQQIGPDLADVVVDDEFRQAFLRIKEQRKLYSESTNGRDVPHPDAVPRRHRCAGGGADRHLRRRRQAVRRRRDDRAAPRRPSTSSRSASSASSPTPPPTTACFYGLATAAMAIMTGWFASVVFRKD